MIETISVQSERLKQQDIKEKILQATTLLVDIDQCIFPGPGEIDKVLSDLSQKMNVVACTSRSLGEMQSEEYPGKNTFLESPLGIFEGGLVIVTNGEFELLCRPDSIRRLAELKKFIEASIEYVGPRKKDSIYVLEEQDPQNPNAYGYLLGADRNRSVPLRIPHYPNQYSLTIWPSGNARTCPLERNYFEIADFLEKLRIQQPNLFTDLSIVRTDGSILVRPLSLDGESIEKLSGVRRLEQKNLLDPFKIIFIGDDDFMDANLADFLNQKGGITFAPENAGETMRDIAQITVQGYAGEAILPLLKFIDQTKNG